VSSPKGNEVKDHYEAVLAANGRQSKKARLTTQRKLLATDLVPDAVASRFLGETIAG